MNKNIELDKDFDIPVYSPVCTFCKNYISGREIRKCRAFPDGIPDEIWTGENDHTKPYKGDHGIQFEHI